MTGESTTPEGDPMAPDDEGGTADATTGGALDRRSVFDPAVVSSDHAGSDDAIDSEETSVEEPPATAASADELDDDAVESDAPLADDAAAQVGSEGEAPGPTGPDPAVVRAFDRQRPTPWSRLIVRVSGLVLAVLVVIHGTDRFIYRDTTETIPIFLSQRWSSPAWLMVEWAMLILAVGHGLIGLHWWTRRSIRSESVRLLILGSASTIVMLLLATTLVTTLQYPV